MEKNFNIWGIGDLHLSLGMTADTAKPMEVFGDIWQNHVAKIEKNWRNHVAAEDVVLVPGDICWANKLSEAMTSLLWLDALPGKKIILRGNHDNWWQSIGRLRESLPSSIYAIHNDVVMVGEVVFCGTRGWSFYDISGFGNQEKLLRREYLRLQESLAKISDAGVYRIALMHFPPFMEKRAPSIFTDLLLEYHIDSCVFGHLHGKDADVFRSFQIKETKFELVSADYLDFSPKHIYNYHKDD